MNTTIDVIAMRAWLRLLEESPSKEYAQARATRCVLTRHDCEALAVAFRAALFDCAFPETRSIARSKAA